ncbi:MAG: anion permease [Spirochaetes bacterium]|nr:anion permease [Spirochaetota bacterium]
MLGEKKITDSLWFTAGISVLAGVIIFLIPIPQSLYEIAEAVPARDAERAWTLLAVFVATIFAFVFKPWPMGTVSFIAIVVLVVTRTLGIGPALSGFGNPIMWIVISAFFISRGVSKSKLGERIAYFFMKVFGKKTLGLSYAFIATNLVLAPAMSSITARMGGTISPIIRALSEVFGSKPEDGTERKVGSFVMFSTFQSDMPISAMFMTAMAGNPLIVQIVRDVIGHELTWAQWTLAALVPGLITIALIPLILYKLYPPEIKETPEAAEMASKKMAEMGPVSIMEKKMIGIFVLVLFLWVFGPTMFGIDATTAALIGLCVMLVIGVLSFEDIKAEKVAWETLVWFATMVMMATQLNTLGIIPWFSQIVGNSVAGLSWYIAFGIIAIVYFYSHYFFASNVAHIAAMYGALLGVSVAIGAPPLFAALVLAYISNLYGGLTHYSTGLTPVIYSMGFVTQRDWWSFGFLFSIVYLVIWLGIGGVWWRLLGLW